VTLKQILHWLFGPVESATHAIEKEIEMIPQNISDALAKIKAAMTSQSTQSAADAQTIANLQGQVASLTSAGQAKDAQIADLQAQLADAQGQLSDIENAVLGLVPQGS